MIVVFILISSNHHPFFAQRYNVRRFLENDSNGKLVLLTYKNCEKLTTYMRQLLVHVLIDREKDLAFSQSNSTTQIKEFK
jgi:hypothetical protein